MAESYELKIMPGRVQAIGNKSDAETYWDVPLLSDEKKKQVIRELAEDPLLAGRFLSGAATESDRTCAGVGESGWRPVCTCGMRMPCRHAQSVLFQFRAEAKRNPLHWLEAAGVDAEALKEEYMKLRADIVRNRSNAMLEQRAKERAAEGVKSSPEDLLVYRLQYGFREPDFWNRDMSIAEWLHPLMKAVMTEGEQELNR